MKTTITKKLASMMLILALMFTLGALSVIAEDGETGNPINADFAYDEQKNLVTIEVTGVSGVFVQYAFVKESTAEDKIKWYPLIGDKKTIDVSKYIPKKEGTASNMVVLLREYNTATKTFSSPTKKTLIARRDSKELKAATKNFYDFEKGEFKNTFSETIEVKFESEAYWTELTKDAEPIKLPIEICPNGVTVQVRLPALDSTSGDSSDSKVNPPSLPIKMKIAPQAKAPKKVSCSDIQIKNPANSKEKITIKALKGATDKMEVSLDKDKWETLKKDIPMTDLKTLLKADDGKGVTVYVRIKATDKKPYSQIAEVKVDFETPTEPQGTT